SAAWELSQAGATVVVLDAIRRPGGMVVTERPGGKDGFVVEGGPDGFLAAEPDIQELAREAGIGGRLGDQVTSGSSLWTGRRLEAGGGGGHPRVAGVDRGATRGGGRRPGRAATGRRDLLPDHDGVTRLPR